MQLLVSATLAQTNPPPFPFAHLIHPGFENYDILPSPWVVDQFNKNSIGGIALLPDGRMATTIFKEYGNATNRNGQIFLLSGVLTATKTGDITMNQITASFREPLGVAVVNGSIYVTEKDRIGKLTPNGANWTYSVEYDKANPVGIRDYGHWFSMGLVYYQGKFNWTLGGFHGYEPADTIYTVATGVGDPEPLKHGTWVQYDPITKTHEFMVHGLRNTGGTSLGPDGTICTTDNQGDWEPSDKFICMEKGQWYGFDGPKSLAKLPGQVEYPPTAWAAHDEISNSLGESVLIPKGKYAGQMFVTDITNGIIDRVFLEKVKGHWQGAFTFVTGGFRAGVYRILVAPDSSTLIVAGLGGSASSGGWSYLKQPLYSCLHKLVPNKKPVLEILAVRSMGPTKMEVEFTEPVNPAAALASGYKITSWKNIAGPGYGEGNHSLQLTHTIANVTLSADNLKATLTLSGLEVGRVVRVLVNPTVKALNGDTLFFKFSDYTMNNFGPADPVSLARMLGGQEMKPFQYSLQKNRSGVELKMATPGNYSVEAWTMEGTKVESIRKEGPFGLTLTREILGTGILMLRIKNEAGHSVSEIVSIL